MIVQVTIGCFHNQCTFCSMYKDKKFRIRSMEEIKADLIGEVKYAPYVKRVFLADGNALTMPTEELLVILQWIKEYYPKCQRVGVYAAPKDVLRKSPEELKMLQEAGVGIAYLGLESGSAEILRAVKKGVTPEQMVEAAHKLKNAGIPLSVTQISGLGGQNHIEEHALRSAEILNQMQPDYLGLLTLLVEPGTEMFDLVEQGVFKLLRPEEVIQETYLLLQNLKLEHCVFRSNHASNYYALAGTLPIDQESLLQQLEALSQEKHSDQEEWFRRL